MSSTVYQSMNVIERELRSGRDKLDRRRMLRSLDRIKSTIDDVHKRIRSLEAKIQTKEPKDSK